MAALQHLEASTHLTVPMLLQISNNCLDEFRTQLASRSSSSTMIPIHVTRLPSRLETGMYLSLDVGGTNLRISAVALLGEGDTSSEITSIVIPKELKTVGAEEFFEWIAQKTDEFLTELKRSSTAEKDKRVNWGGMTQWSMGVTFSFPIEQAAIDQGIVLDMGKSFNIPGLIGSDVVKLMQRAFDAKNVNVKVRAIVNDTVGTLLAGAYSHPNTFAGIILGTGTNAALLCPSSLVENRPQIAALPKKEGEQFVVNTEWSLMGVEFLTFTEFDRDLDKESSRPEFQRFEKMLGGMYLGELARLAILKLVVEDGVFKGQVPNVLMKPYSLGTDIMSRIERELSDAARPSVAKLKLVREIFDLSEDFVGEEDIHAVASAVACFSRRSAKLAAAAIAALTKLRFPSGLEQIVTIAVDGSVYRHYGNGQYAEIIKSTLRDILGPQESAKIKFVAPRNAGCVGAALAAMLYSTK